MHLLEVFRTPTFRLSAYCAVAFSILTILLFAFIFWQTAIVETKRVDHILVRDAEIIADESPQQAELAVERRVAADFRRIVYISLFDTQGGWVVGNLKRFPLSLPLDGQAHRTSVGITIDSQFNLQIGRLVGRRMADGRILIIGRNVDSLDDLEDVVLRALRLGLIPAVLLSLTGGALLSLPAQRHMRAVREQAERIAQGEIWHRLPTRDADDYLDRMAVEVNQMLDSIGQLLDEVKSASDHIVHDLRTPLARVRTHLDRAREAPLSNDELLEIVDRAITGLDQSLRIISALRRIAHIEGRQRRAGFADIDMAAIVVEVGEFYAPLAEEKQLRFTVAASPVSSTYGDRDLLIEAVANLVDNAIKYTPAGGQIVLGVVEGGEGPVVRVEDDGPGIPPQERQAVMGRFYRAEGTRHIQGCGLGLSLVDAIVRLHGFEIGIRDTARGCVFELCCRPRVGGAP